MDTLIPRAAEIGEMLKARKETIGIAESSTGGLISAALLAQPGASAYYLGGAVVYTRQARSALTSITDDDMRQVRSASEPYAAKLAKQARAKGEEYLLERNALYTLYQHEYGHNIVAAHEELRADLARKEDARRLKVKPGTPLLQIDRIGVALDGTRVEWRTSRCDTSHLVYAVTLT